MIRCLPPMRDRDTHLRPCGHPLRGFLCLWLLAFAGCRARGAGPPGRTSEQANSHADDEKGLHARLRAALEAKGPGYVPRTRHKRADGTPVYTNRLIFETSPY